MMRVSNYYNKFSAIYDSLSPENFYRKARETAISELNLGKNSTVLSIACGTGQNFKYFYQYLDNTGLIIGLDFSEGMLKRAKKKIVDNHWTNIRLIQGDANKISEDWLKERLSIPELTIDSTICELGLTAIPNWRNVIDRMINVTKPGGRIVIMDWYMKKLTLTGKYVNWIGKADITRPIWQYFKDQVENFAYNDSFNNGRVFVATGIKREISNAPQSSRRLTAK